MQLLYVIYSSIKLIYICASVLCIYIFRTWCLGKVCSAETIGYRHQRKSDRTIREGIVEGSFSSKLKKRRKMHSLLSGRC